MTQSSARKLRIGTRGSRLALVQAETVRAHLAGEGVPAELVVIRTSGDRIQDRPLAEAGGKGLFTKEIEEALLSGVIDLAVHSAKDLPTFLPAGLMLAACLQREDPRDVFVSRKARSIADLPPGASVGTSSPRRQALVKRIRPDIATTLLRGNVETRLRKLEAGEADATILALAGLKRLGLIEAATRIMSIEEFLPAVGQGAIAIEARSDDRRARDVVARIDHAETSRAIEAERAFLSVLDGSCRTPIAGHAVIEQSTLTFRGLVARPDGNGSHDVARQGPVENAAVIGRDAGEELKRRAGPGFIVRD
ncbi:MAG TPA: hydroxymethylbilane synthase [Pseudorhodoplanes sp.]|jgi:hydroxymethylbilane synthase|nr:hydroxymethylbilane synthase [Pseudorhodoplanes sp.]